MRTVLITGARAPIALDLALSFRRAGREAHLADSVTPWAARLCGAGRFWRLPPPRFAFAAFAEALTRLVERLDPELIVPTCEEVFFLAEAARRNGFSSRLLAPPPETLRRLHSKIEFAALARACGLEAPATTRASGFLDVEAFSSCSHALVFKPEFSRFASHALIKPTREALRGVDARPDAPWAVQDFVEGEEVCIWSAARAGRLVAFAAYRPRWRIDRSASFYFETDHDPALVAMAQAVAAATEASGHLSFDVIRTADGRIAPIECNPRGVSGLHLFDAEARLAHALLRESEGMETPTVPARHLAPAMWLFGAPTALRRRGLRAFRDDLACSRDVFAKHGPGASAGALLDAARFLTVGLSRGRSASGQSTDDIEWNGEPIA